MKKASFSFMTLLAGASLFMAGCGSEDVLNGEQSQRIWKAVVPSAVKGDVAEVGDGTRALFIGGHTNRYGALWDDGDVVQVYRQNGTKVDGQLTPDESSWGTKSATLNGTLTGSFAVEEQLTLYQPSKTMDFTGQKGTLQTASDKTYQTGTVTVESAQENTLTLSNVRLQYLNYYVRFLLSDDDTKERLHPSSLTLHAVSGGDIVLTMDEDGNVTTGDLVVNTVVADGAYPGEIFVALKPKDDARITYELEARVGDDIYVGPITSKDGSGYGTYSPSFTTTGELRKCFRYMKKVSANTLTLSAAEASVAAGATTTVAVSENTGGGALTGSSSDESVATVSIEGNTITITGVAAGTADITIRSGMTEEYASASKTISVTVTPREPDKGNAPANCQLIDLGLPSGTLWANMNVGATTETGSGLYFAWGSTTGYAGDDATHNFQWSNAPYYTGDGTTHSWSKYTGSDGRPRLEAADDAASVNWAGDWRMPTSAEITELLSNTTQEWTTINGVNGYKLTSKTNDKYIFLPHVGSRNGDGLQSAKGGYWASSLNTSKTYTGSYLLILSTPYILANAAERKLGYPVRAVIGGTASSLKFAESAISKSVGDAAFFVNIYRSGSTSAITYTSDATDVVSVNSTTGEMSIVGAGTANIMATLPADGTYTKATATLTVTVAYKNLSEASVSDIGKVICSNAHIHNKVYNVEDGAVASGMIAYVGSSGGVDASSTTYKGLAIALEDCSTSNCGVTANKNTTQYKWYTEDGGNCVSQNSTIATALTYKNGIACTETLVNSNGSGVTTFCSGHTHNAAKATAGYNVNRPSGTSSWFLPSMGQWNLILQGLTGESTDLTTGANNSYKAANVNTKIIAAEGTGVWAGYYWSSTEYDNSNAWDIDFYNGCADNQAKNLLPSVRACFAF